MIDDGKNPFEGQETIEDEEKTYPETEPYDSEIESVVDDFEKWRRVIKLVQVWDQHSRKFSKPHQDLP